jgi:hypothetical protein
MFVIVDLFGMDWLAFKVVLQFQLAVLDNFMMELDVLIYHQIQLALFVNLDGILMLLVHVAFLFQLVLKNVLLHNIGMETLADQKVVLIFVLQDVHGMEISVFNIVQN